MEISMLAFDSYDGTEICFTDEQRGQGRPTILLHAFIIDSFLNWHETGIADAILSSGRRVICPDMRGHGESHKPHSASAYADHAMANDVVALIDALGLEEVDLVGYSMGSCVAIQVAASDQRIKSLVLGGAGIAECEPWDADSRQSEIQSLLDEHPSEPGFYRQFVDQEGADRLAVAARLEGDEFPQVTKELTAKVNVPVCVLNGAEDSDPAEMAALFSRGTAKRCEGDHLSAIWMPSFTEQVLQFWQEI